MRYFIMYRLLLVSLVALTFNNAYAWDPLAPRVDTDRDNDGIHDSYDRDIGNDGIVDYSGSSDMDGDGIRDSYDRDMDNDGTIDSYQRGGSNIDIRGDRY